MITSTTIHPWWPQMQFLFLLHGNTSPHTPFPVLYLGDLCVGDDIFLVQEELHLSCYKIKCELPIYTGFLELTQQSATKVIPQCALNLILRVTRVGLPLKPVEGNPSLFDFLTSDGLPGITSVPWFMASLSTISVLVITCSSFLHLFSPLLLHVRTLVTLV